MKGSTFTGVRGKQLLLTLIAIVCVILLIWAWEKTPLVATMVPRQEHLNVLPHAFLFKNTEEYAENTINWADTLESVNVKDEKEDASSLAEAPETVIVEKDKQDSVVYIVPVGGEAASAAPMSSPVANTTKSTENYNIPGVIPTEKNDCNYAKGKWVADEKRPLYSGFGCKQWLSSMWACRLMQRTDFTYENFRWQPGNCKMPEFDGFAILRKMQDKTIALVGDSLGRQQFQSLMCMLTGGKERPEVEDVGKEYGLARAQGAVRPNGWAYWFKDTNTTVIYYWSASLCELEPLNLSNPSTNYAMHLDRPAWFLKHYLHRFDVLVLNTGHHWNRGKLNANRWEMYVGGMPVGNRNIAQIGSAKNFTIYNVIHWLDSQLPHHPRLKAFLRTISPRHFANGDWNTGGSCDNTSPLLRGSRVSQDSSSDAIAEGAVRGTSVKLLDITALSELRDEGHISKYSAKAASGIHDCLHWCLPGVPDTWNEILLAQI